MNEFFRRPVVRLTAAGLTAMGMLGVAGCGHTDFDPRCYKVTLGASSGGAPSKAILDKLEVAEPKTFADMHGLQHAADDTMDAFTQSDHKYGQPVAGDVFSVCVSGSGHIFFDKIIRQSGFNSK